MKTIIINGSEYKIECIYAVKRAFNKNIGVHLQLQIFKDDKQIDKIDSYAMKKIEEFIKRINIKWEQK